MPAPPISGQGVSASDLQPLPDSTLSLLSRAKAGDREARELLCRRYLPRLRRWAAGRLPRAARDILDTEDIVQDALLKTIDHLDTFEPRFDGAFHAYLRQVLRNRLQDELKRCVRRPNRAELPADRPDPFPSPLEVTVGREALRRYESALSRLPSDARELVVMRIEMDANYAEMAEAVGRPSPEAARKALHRALLLLAKEMGND